jgi:hypothetical protein
VCIVVFVSEPPVAAEIAGKAPPYKDGAVIHFEESSILAALDFRTDSPSTPWNQQSSITPTGVAVVIDAAVEVAADDDVAISAVFPVIEEADRPPARLVVEVVDSVSSPGEVGGERK